MTDDGRLVFVQGGGKRRSAVACQRCQTRKVRCSVTTTGHPCANCRLDGTQCEVFPRKRHTCALSTHPECRIIAESQQSRHQAIRETRLRLASTTRSQQETNDMIVIPPNAATQTQQGEHAQNDWVSDPLPENLQNLDNLDLQQNNVSENALDEGKNPSAFAEAVQANSPFNTKRPFHSGMSC